VVDLIDDGAAFDRIFNAIHIHCALVSEWMEHIQCMYSFGSALFHAKDEINPQVQLIRHMFALQGSAMQVYEITWTIFSPSRQYDVVDD